MSYENVDGFDDNLLKSTKRTNKKGGNKFLLGKDLELSPRELEILHMSSRGMTADEIATELSITLAGVKKFIKSMTSTNHDPKNLQKPTLTELAARAESHGILNNFFVETLKRKSE